ncbi:MAG: hypothetical protein WB611_27875 [Stellaceae bacterium]
MMLKTLAGAIAVAGLLATTSVVPAAQAQPGPDNGHAWVLQNGQWVWSPRLNVKNSERYARLVQTDPAFRQARMRKECGPITDPNLREQCIASFNGNEGTAYGSSTEPNQGYRSNYGR